MSFFVQVLDDECKRLLIARLKPCSIPAGHDLCREGMDADCLWIIEEGTPFLFNSFWLLPAS